MSNYRKVQEGEPMYPFIQASQRAGQWICDSYDHNSEEGCSNPDCFKYRKVEEQKEDGR